MLTMARGDDNDTTSCSSNQHHGKLTTQRISVCYPDHIESYYSVLCAPLNAHLVLDVEARNHIIV